MVNPKIRAIFDCINNLLHFLPDEGKVLADIGNPLKIVKMYFIFMIINMVNFLFLKPFIIM